jgi:hypothetical protein
MFYCDRCRIKNEWPEGIVRSHGPCEVCGFTTSCNDVPSSCLSIPTTPEDDEKNKE